MAAVANLWAQRIINEDKTYAQVPAGLKDEVAKILEDSGHEDLITEE
ncbi:MAG: hypothetical protein NC247_01960 [Ruminococcus flavefaciens]|nr:hypothetical protein [Ruminococcus flavefaciens]